MVIITYKRYSAFRQNLKDDNIKKYQQNVALSIVSQLHTETTRKLRPLNNLKKKNTDLSEIENLQYKKTADSV